MSIKFFDKQRLSTRRKICPNCAEEIPLAALFCDACDYNFIASGVSYRHKLLNPPTISEAPSRGSVTSVSIFTERCESVKPVGLWFKIAGYLKTLRDGAICLKSGVTGAIRSVPKLPHA
jgi:hypothetical protein